MAVHNNPLNNWLVDCSYRKKKPFECSTVIRTLPV